MGNTHVNHVKNHVKRERGRAYIYSDNEKALKNLANKEKVFGTNLLWPYIVTSAPFGSVTNTESVNIAATIESVFHVVLWVLAIVFEWLVWGKVNEWKHAADGTLYKDMGEASGPYALIAAVGLSASAFALLVALVVDVVDDEAGPLPHAWVRAVLMGGLDIALLFTLIASVFAIDAHNNDHPEFRNHSAAALALIMVLRKKIEVNLKVAKDYITAKKLLPSTPHEDSASDS